MSAYSVYSLDDDPVFNELLQAVLRKFGAHPQAYSKASLFRERLRVSLPTVCLIDLNLEDGLKSYGLIAEMRKQYPPSLPILVISTQSESHAIAHALECGANDYILKPINREILASKLSRYFMSPEILDAKLGFPPSAPGGMKASLSVPLRIEEVDELGISISGPHLIPKGCVISLRSDLFQSWRADERPLLVSVAETWTEKDGRFGAYCEFDPTDEPLLSGVRAWISG